MKQIRVENIGLVLLEVQHMERKRLRIIVDMNSCILTYFSRNAQVRLSDKSLLQFISALSSRHSNLSQLTPIVLPALTFCYSIYF